MSMSRDLTCKETLSAEDSERVIVKESGGVSRKFQVASAPSRGSFRVAFPPPKPKTTYTAIVKPVASRAYTVNNPGAAGNNRVVQSSSVAFPSNAPSLQQNINMHRSYTVSSPSPSTNKLMRTFPTPEPAEYGTGVPSTSTGHQLSSHLPYAQSTLLLRPPVSRDLPNAHTENISMYINTMRLQHTQPQMAPVHKSTPGGFSSVQVFNQQPRTETQRLSSDTVAASPNLFSTHPSSRTPVAASPVPQTQLFPGNRFVSTNGNKISSNLEYSRFASSPSRVSPSLAASNINRPVVNSHLLMNTASNSVPGSPIPQSLLNHNMSTPSPRPSILRKNITPGSAKRKLPFAQEPSCSPVNGTSSSGPTASVRTIIQNATAASTSVAMALHAVGLPQSQENGNAEETPRKRLRKQQFDLNQPPEQVRMAIGVEPITTAVWNLDPQTQGSKPPEKKKRGRPRTDSRPATATPQPYYIQTGLRHVFVSLPLEGSDKKMSKNITGRDVSTPNRTLSVPPVHFDEKPIQPVPEIGKGKANNKKTSVSKNVVARNKLKNGRRKSGKSGVSTDGEGKLLKEKVHKNKLYVSDPSRSAECEEGMWVASFLANCLIANEKDVELGKKLNVCNEEDNAVLRFSKDDRQVEEPGTSTSSHPERDSWDLRSNHFKNVEPVSSALRRRANRKKLLLCRRRVQKQLKARALVVAKKLVLDSERCLRSLCENHGGSCFDDLTVEGRLKVVQLLERILVKRTNSLKKWMKLGLENDSFSDYTDVKDVELLLNSRGDSHKDEPNSKSKWNAPASSLLRVRTCERAESQSPEVECGPNGERPTSDLGVGSFDKWCYDRDLSDDVIVEQVVDEILGFLSSSGDSSSKIEDELIGLRTVARTQVNRRIGFSDCKDQAVQRVLKGRRSRARLFTSDSFSSILREASDLKDLQESQLLMDNVFLTGSHFKTKSWWGSVSKPASACKIRERVRDVSVPEDLDIVNESSSSIVDKLVMMITGTTVNDLATLRLAQMKRELTEQMELEHKLLFTFEKFLKVYDPVAYSKLLLDVSRDYEDSDTPDECEQKKIRRLRQTLLSPPISVTSKGKGSVPDSGETVFINPSEELCNNVMKGISPFWRGQCVPDNDAGFYISKSGHTMSGRLDDYSPLELDNHEYYKEDVSEYASKQKFVTQFAEFENMRMKIAQIPPPAVSSVSDVTRKGVTPLNSRRWQHKQRSDSVLVLGCRETPVLQAKPNPAIDEDLMRRCRNSREMFATTLKTVHQTTVIMLQSRDALVKHMERRADEVGESSEKPKRGLKTQKAKICEEDLVESKGEACQSVERAQLVQTKEEKTVMKQPRAPRTPVITETAFSSRQMRRAIQESLRVGKS